MKTRVVALVFLELLYHICLCWGLTRCPLAEEGKPYTLTCVGSKRKTGVSESFLRWRVTSNKSEFTITTCKADVKTCETNDKRNYLTSNNIDTQNYNSTLTITNVTRELNDAVFVCQLWNFQDNTQEFLSCQLAVYKKGDNTSCNVTSLEDGNIFVWCNSTNIYPRVRCLYEQTVDGNSAGGGKMKSETKRLHGLLNANCERIIRPWVDGVHVIKFTVLPDYDAENVNNTAVIITQNVTVTNTPQVKIEQSQKGNVCLGKKTPITLTCKATLYSKVPVFQLSIGGKDVKNTHTVNRPVMNHPKLLEHTANFSLLADRSYANNVVLCTISYNDSAHGENVITSTKVLDLNWPPDVAPVTQLNGESVNGDFMYVTKGENLSVQCSVLGGHPTVSYTNLSCSGPNHTYAVGDFTNGLTLNIPGEATRSNIAISCACYATHVTNCYSLKKIFKMLVPGAGTSDRWPEANTLSTLSYIITGSVLLILVTFIIAISIFVCRHNKDLYALYRSKRGFHRYKIHRSRSTTKTPPGLPPPRIPPRPKPAVDLDNLPRPHPGSNSSVTSDDDSGEWTEDEISISEPFNQSSRVLFSLNSTTAENNNNNSNIDYNNDYLEPLTVHPPPLPPRKIEPSPRFHSHEPRNIDQDNDHQDVFLRTSLSDSPPPLPYRPPDLTSLSDCPPPLPYRPPDLVSMRSTPSNNLSRVNDPDSSDANDGHVYESGHSESDASDGDVHSGHNAQAPKRSQPQPKNLQDTDGNDTLVEMASH